MEFEDKATKTTSTHRYWAKKDTADIQQITIILERDLSAALLRCIRTAWIKDRSLVFRKLLLAKNGDIKTLL